MKEIRKLPLEESLYYFNNLINDNSGINQGRYYDYNRKPKLYIHNTNYEYIRINPKEYQINYWIKSKRCSRQRRVSEEKLIINKGMLYRIDISKNKER